MSNSLDPDQARRIVGPDLGPNWLPKLSADNTSRQRVKRHHAAKLFLRDKAVNETEMQVSSIHTEDVAKTGEVWENWGCSRTLRKKKGGKEAETGEVGETMDITVEVAKIVEAAVYVEMAGIVRRQKLRKLCGKTGLASSIEEVSETARKQR